MLPDLGGEHGTKDGFVGRLALEFIGAEMVAQEAIIKVGAEGIKRGRGRQAVTGADRFQGVGTGTAKAVGAVSHLTAEGADVFGKK